MTDLKKNISLKPLGENDNVRRKIVLYFLRKWDITGYMGI